MAEVGKATGKALTFAPLRRVTIKTSAAAALLDVTDRWITKLMAAEGVQPTARGEWNLVEVVQAYLKTVRTERKTGSQSEAANRKREAEASRIEMQNAKEAAKLIETDEALATLDDVFGLLKSEIESVPARVTRDLTVRNKIKTEHDEILSRTAERLTEAGATLRARGDVAGAEQETEPR